MESRNQQGRTSPARSIVIARMRHEGRGVEDTGAVGRRGIRLREADAVVWIHTSIRMARSATSSPFGGGRHGSDMRADRKRLLATPKSGSAWIGSVTGTCSVAKSTAARAALRAQSPIERWTCVSWSSCECMVVVVMVPAVDARRVRAVRAGATERKGLPTQSCHGQQGRDQE
jgi:hypothetical protein